MKKLKLIIGDNQEQRFDNLLYWLSTSAELETKEFNNLEEGLDYLINLVINKLGSSDQKSRQEEINFLKLVFETDLQLMENLSLLLKIKND